MKVRVKSWIETNGEVLFGEGRRRLLELVESTGSLNKAAKAMKMSYRAAWGKIKETEERLGYKLLESKTGGLAGGGSKLTPKGSALLKAFRDLEKAINAAAQDQFERLFLKGGLAPGV